MSRYILTIEYDGTPFCGWQRQKDVATAQGRLEDAMLPFLKKKITLFGSGRTDTGVHALGQVAHFDFDGHIDCFRLMECMNAYLLDVPMNVLSLQEAAEGFHARASAIERQYLYKILNRQAKPCLDANRVWHVSPRLDAAAMHRAAQFLVGKHDFSTFRAAGCQAKSPVKTMDQITVTQDGDILAIRVVARSFLYRQVRNIVGSLVLVGRGKWSTQDLLDALGACDRRRAGPTAPACGLYFVGTKYPCAQ
ncbi:MAG: tRNA pseudouridine(38-40) synthase TruA [Holosporaceae bacterium]|jgi:tRNA pseudouridine38-40 synthase|nr:tRNA pseudouridine(38-40) synthase TruA [Holosporaceae bacterium]